MQELMLARLETVKKELEKGQIELQKVENQRTYLREMACQYDSDQKIRCTK